LAQPALDRTAIARLLHEQGNLVGSRGDEFLALAPGFLAARGLLGEMARGRGIRLLAGAVETFPQRLGHTRVLLIERFPLVAQRLHFLRKLAHVAAELSERLGPLAQLDPGVVLPERLPAFQL